MVVNTISDRIKQNWEDLTLEDKIRGGAAQSFALGSMIGGAVFIAKIAIPLILAAGALTPLGWGALAIGITFIAAGAVITAFHGRELLKTPKPTGFLATIEKLSMAPQLKKLSPQHRNAIAKTFAIAAGTGAIAIGISTILQESIIKKIVLQTLGELSLNLAFGAVNTAFTPETQMPRDIRTPIKIITLINLVLRISSGILEFMGRGNSWLERKLSVIPSIIFGEHLDWFLGTLIHEYGHAFAMNILQKGVHPTIEMSIRGGETHWNADSNFGRSNLSKKFGLSRSQVYAIISAAGPGFAVGFSTLLLVIALDMQKHAASRTMISFVLFDIIHHISYALSALKANPIQGHDFVNIWKNGGIHPIVSAGIIAALPIFALAVRALVKSV